MDIYSRLEYAERKRHFKTFENGIYYRTQCVFGEGKNKLVQQLFIEVHDHSIWLNKMEWTVNEAGDIIRKPHVRCVLENGNYTKGMTHFLIKCIRNGYLMFNTKKREEKFNVFKLIVDLYDSKMVKVLADRFKFNTVVEGARND